MSQLTLFEATINKPSYTITPRDYQNEALEESFRLWGKGIEGVLLRIFTGGGKTICASMLADLWLKEDDRNKIMVISYEKELVWQFAQELEDVLRITPGIEMEGEHVEPGSDTRLVVASRQTLAKHRLTSPEQLVQLHELGLTDEDLGLCTFLQAKTLLRWARKNIHGLDTIRDQLLEWNQDYKCNHEAGAVSRLFKFNNEDNWLVIWDEAHKHAYQMQTVGHIVDWFGANPKHRRLGMTATPKRADGVSIGHKMFPGIAIDYPLFTPKGRCAVRDGYAVPYRQKYIEVEGIDFKDINALCGEDQTKWDAEIAKRLETQLTEVCGPMLEKVDDRRTLIFSPSVEMARNVAHFVNARVKVTCECGKIQWVESIEGRTAGAQCIQCGATMATVATSQAIQAEAVWGEVPAKDRREVYERHQNGDVQFLSVCGLCVAKGSLVFTDEGEVPIQRVTTEMKLWDGIEFVSHDGVISKGVRPVIEYAGLKATGDHNVWTIEGWNRFADCKLHGIAIKVAAIGGKEVQESCGYYRGNHSTWKESPGWIGSAVRWLRGNKCQVFLRTQGRPGWLQALCKNVRCSKLVANALSFSKETLRKFQRQVLQGLWWARNKVQVFLANGNGVVDDEQSWDGQKFDHRSQGQQRTLRAREYSLGQSGGTSEKQETTEVFDILNAGPRSRFTANGLIVSNCREGYNDPDISCVTIFRPVSRAASSLAEQMKGRGSRPQRGLLDRLSTASERLAAIAESSKPDCLIIDLVGVTGLGDCATTVHIYAEGCPDEVVERAQEYISDGLEDVQEAIERAEAEIAREKAERKREREERDRVACEKARERAKAGARARYTETDVGHGSKSRTQGNASDKQYKYLRFMGLEIVGREVSGSQAGRMIDQLLRGETPKRVAYLNAIIDEHFLLATPSRKQLAYLRQRGYQPFPGITPKQASEVIDGFKKGKGQNGPLQNITEMLVKIAQAPNSEWLDGFARSCQMKRHTVTPQQWQILVTAATRRRQQLGIDR